MAWQKSVTTTWQLPLPPEYGDIFVDIQPGSRNYACAIALVSSVVIVLDGSRSEFRSDRRSERFLVPLLPSDC